jgi:cytochrome c556
MQTGTGLRLEIFALAAVVIVGANFAFAHEGAKGVVKERMELMKQQQKDAKLISDMAKGKVKFDAVKAAAAARDLVTTSQKIPDLFPKGSDGHPSEALPEIWTDWDQFTGNAKDLETIADTLAATFEAGGDWKSDFAKVSEACKTCHESFRMKETGKHH